MQLGFKKESIIVEQLAIIVLCIVFCQGDAVDLTQPNSQWIGQHFEQIADNGFIRHAAHFFKVCNCFFVVFTEGAIVCL